MKPTLLTLALAVAFGVAPLHAQQRRPAPAAKAAAKSAGDYQADAAVVRESQEQALEMAKELVEQAKDPKAQAAIAAAIREMERALKLLEAAKDAPAKLKEAVAAQQAAYAALLKLAAREHQVTRSKNSKGGKQGEQSQREREMLENLDLKDEKERYETQKQAKPQQTPEQREQLQVLNRLKELAQRQQDLNERLKELQNALQEAKSDQEKEDIRRRLKRLREEEQQMLADVDELKQRMEKPENQSRMADEKKQLDQTRDQIQKAGEAMDKGAVPQALANGTRAERDLQKLRDEFRQKNSNEFAEEMRQMRAAARELAQKQEELGKQLATANDGKRKSLTDSGDRKELTQQLDAQRERFTNLVQHATQLTEQAENVEPLLAKQLYDTLRKTAQADANNVRETTDDLLRRGMLTQSLYDRLKKTGEEGGAKSLEATAELLKQNFLPQAGAAEQKARKTIEDFKGGLERAAESVLGSEAESLRAARNQLDALKEQLDKAIAANDPNAKPGEGKQPGEGEPNSKAGKGEGKQGQPDQATKQPGEGEGKGEGKQPGKAAQNSPGKGEGKQPGEGKGDGNGEGKGEGQDGKQAQRNGSPQRGSLTRSGGGGEGGGANRNTLENFLGGGGRGGTHLGPVYGEEYGQWSDRLREVEEMLDQPDLRNDVAHIREEARTLRLEARKAAEKPDWLVLRNKLSQPLAEVRKRIADELAKRESREALVPIDRDPVPGKFSELVRRYYENLGRAEAK